MKITRLLQASAVVGSRGTHAGRLRLRLRRLGLERRGRRAQDDEARAQPGADAPVVHRAARLRRELTEATDGRWNIEVYPNSTLGDQAEYVQSVSDGVIDLAIVSAPQLENVERDFVVFSLPTVFDSIEHQMRSSRRRGRRRPVCVARGEQQHHRASADFTQGARSIYLKDGPPRPRTTSPARRSASRRARSSSR